MPAETVQRYACDSAISRITGQSELEHELNHASRTLPAPTRRALEARDRHCVFPGCTRPLSWCDGHHLVWWILERTKDRNWKARAPIHPVRPNTRSA